MPYRKSFALVLFLLFVVFPGVVAASSVVRSGDQVSIAADQEVDGDFYGLGDSIAVSGKVSEDLLLAGRKLTLNGEIKKDIGVIGGTVDFHGTAGDDVRIVGGTVAIAGEIAGDLVVIASELKVLSTANIGGDILFFGNIADISGTVGKNIIGNSTNLRVDGEVKGGIDVTTSALVLGDRAKVANNVSYTSNTELSRSQNAEVGGEITRSSEVLPIAQPAKLFFIPLLVTMFASLVWFLLFKPFTTRVKDGARLHFLRSLSIGFGLFFLAPISAFILIASTLGSILGVTIMFLYIAGILVSLGLIGIVAGSYLVFILPQTKDLLVVQIVFGILIVHALLYIPVFGPVVLVSILLATFGSVAERCYLSLRSL
jgi:hypothetical protein